MKLTRRQHEIHQSLRDYLERFEHPPTYDEFCHFLGLSSRGSLHKHIQALIRAGLVEPTEGLQRGIRLVETEQEEGIPYLGRIAAGNPIEAIPRAERMTVPDELLGHGSCYVLQIAGDSMIEEGIFDGDYVVIEQQEWADNGDIVVALINNDEVTLKRIEQKPNKVILYPANASMKAMAYRADEVRIQGILRGLIRHYR
ncbi:MAG: transcriptional repressor LexA [Chromatiales bacterium]|jgi:repressor LexA